MLHVRKTASIIVPFYIVGIRYLISHFHYGTALANERRNVMTEQHRKEIEVNLETLVTHDQSGLKIAGSIPVLVAN